MKKAFLVLPLAIVLANCSSTRNSSGSSANSGTRTDASASASMASSGSGSTTSATQGSSTGAWNNGNTMSAGANSSGSMSGGMGSGYQSSNSSAASGQINWDVYDPNNYMMDPQKYRKPRELGKTGGWTYNKDWRRNTNFTADAVGQWQLVITPEVAANWLPDTRRPETYASFWTPEAVMARYQATMAAAARTRDSLAALEATATYNADSRKKGRKQPSLASAGNAGMKATTEVSGGTWGSGSGGTGSVGTGGTASASASMGTTGFSSGTDATGNMTNDVTAPFSLKAVNGNNFMLPTLNMYLDNGSFTAYTGCNNAVGTIVVDGSSLHFEEANPTANVECIGGFDQAAFLDKLRRADSYDVVNNQFRLKQGNQVLMVFGKAGM